MGKSTPEIMEGDEEWDVLDFILDICGVEEEGELTRELWEKNFDKILELVKGISSS